MRYFISFLIAVGIVILIIILLIRAIFGGGEPAEPKAQLLSYNRPGTSMRLTIDGPINSELQHRQVQIDISQRQTQIRTITGYENRTLDSKTFGNNPNAYGVFLRAIDLQGYTDGDNSESLIDERGYCPTGQRYIFEIIDNDNVTQRYWSTSCGGVHSFKGNADVTIGLFRAQIPDYEQITQNIPF